MEWNDIFCGNENFVGMYYGAGKRWQLYYLCDHQFWQWFICFASADVVSAI